jgi:O-antigen biosynthesis protein
VGEDARDDLPWTGERYIPHEGGPLIAYEHTHRYLLASALADGRNVLDLGSGEGYGTALLASHASRALGVDIDPAAVAHANAKYGGPSVRFEVADMADASAIADGFDLIVCFEAIEHVASPEDVVDAARRALAVDGVFIVSTPNKKVYSEDRNFVNEFHEHEFFLDEFETMLRGHFAHVEMLGQHVAGVSFAWPLGHDDNGVTFVGDAQGDGKPGALTNLVEPMYFIALCSAAPIDIGRVQTSVYLDGENSLISGYEAMADRAGRLELEVHELRAHDQVLMRAKDDFEQLAADRAHEVKVVALERDDFARAVQEMRGSLSWRLTRPLRGIARMVGRSTRSQ